MRTLTFFLLPPVLGSLLLAQDNVKTDQVAPDKDLSAARVLLSAEERERLLRITRVAVPTVSQKDADDDAQATPAAARRSTVEEIEELEALLSKASASNSRDVSQLLLELLESPKTPVRLTALQWIAGRHDIAAAAIARALRDPEDLVRTSAAQFLLERGLSEAAVDEMKALRDESAAKQRIAPLFEKSSRQ